jgi:hypothetical protein
MRWMRPLDFDRVDLELADKTVSSRARCGHKRHQSFRSMAAEALGRLSKRGPGGDDQEVGDDQTRAGGQRRSVCRDDAVLANDVEIAGDVTAAAGGPDRATYF